MTPRTPSQALAHAAGAMVGVSDVAHVLAVIVADAAEVMSAAAIGILVSAEDDSLEVLTATSHRAGELELLQAQHGAGPCVDAVHSGTQVSELDPAAIPRRWPDVGPLIIAAGYSSVHAFPLRWHDSVLGAMNVFHAGSVPGDDVSVMGQGFADIATAVILQPGRLDRAGALSKVTEALVGRAVIEQAKGVLAYQEDLPMDAAYDRLLAMADDGEQALTAAARTVIRQAQGPRTRA
jgi:hypothetical protein